MAKGRKQQAATVRKAGATHHRVQLLEVFARNKSALSAVWAAHGKTVVRIVQRDSKVPMKPMPRIGKAKGQIKAGRVVNWALNLHVDADKRALLRFVSVYCPRDIWTAPSCRTRCTWHRLTHARTGKRPVGEDYQDKVLLYCRLLHRHQQELGGRSHHEQPGRSKRFFDSTQMPWAISPKMRAVLVSACAFGKREPSGKQRLLGKVWRIESSSAALLSGLEPYQCAGGHAHAICKGRNATMSAFYPRRMGEAIFAALHA